MLEFGLFAIPKSAKNHVLVLPNTVSSHCTVMQHRLNYLHACPGRSIACANPIKRKI